jgi:hypothetical protein
MVSLHGRFVIAVWKCLNQIVGLGPGRDMSLVDLLEV